MPKRPRQHVIEDFARAALRSAFAEAGWTTEDLDEDYGEDLLIRIFENGQATPFSFLVQSKATDHIERFLSQDKKIIAFSIKSEHAKHWNQFWEPVVLAVYDANSKHTYWEVIQTFLDSASHLRLEGGKSTTVTVRVPTDNLLDEEGLRRLRNRTIRRFERLEAQKQGAQVLIETLKEQWGVDVAYEPEEGILILPAGRFEPDASGGKKLIAFGRHLARLEDLERKFGIQGQRATEWSLELLEQFVEAFKPGRGLQLTDRSGSVIEKWRSLGEFVRYLKGIE